MRYADYTCDDRSVCLCIHTDRRCDQKKTHTTQQSSSSVLGGFPDVPQPPSIVKRQGVFAVVASFYGCVIVTTSGGPGTRGTDSWLHATDSHKNVGPDLLL